jgi:hypothetical protein
MLIVNKSSPGDGTIVIDGESKTVRSGRNVFYEMPPNNTLHLAGNSLALIASR